MTATTLTPDHLNKIITENQIELPAKWYWCRHICKKRFYARHSKPYNLYHNGSTNDYKTFPTKLVIIHKTSGRIIRALNYFRISSTISFIRLPGDGKIQASIRGT